MKKKNIIKELLLTSLVITMSLFFSIQNTYADEQKKIVTDLFIQQDFYPTVGNSSTPTYTFHENYVVDSYRIGTDKDGSERNCLYGCTYVTYTNNIGKSFDTMQIVSGGNNTTGEDNNNQLIEETMNNIYMQLVRSDYYSAATVASGLADLLLYADRSEFSGIINDMCPDSDERKDCWTGTAVVVNEDFENKYLSNYTNFCKIFDDYIVTKSVNKDKDAIKSKIKDWLYGDNESNFCIRNNSESTMCYDRILAGGTTTNIAVTCFDQGAKLDVIDAVMNSPAVDPNIIVLNNDIQTNDHGIPLREIAPLVEDKSSWVVTGTNYITYLYDYYNALSKEDHYVCASNEDRRVFITQPSTSKPTLEKCKTALGDDATILKLKYSVKGSTSPISNNSSLMTCSWKTETNDGIKSTSKVMISTSTAYDGGRGGIRIGVIENVDLGLYTNLALSNSDYVRLLNKDQSMLQKFENSFYADKPTIEVIETAKTVAIVIGVAAIVAQVASAIITGGATIPAIALTTLRAIGQITWNILTTTVIVGTLEVVENFIIDAKCLTGTCPVKAYFGYTSFNGCGEKCSYSGTKVNAKCTYDESQSEDSGEIDENFEVTCESIMSGEFGKIVKTIMNIIRFAGVALLVLLGAIDFIGPIVSGDQEALQKSGGKFVKRIIVLVLILFVPAIVELLLSLIGRSCSSGL